MTIVRSMIAEFSEHQTANFFLHSGSGLQGRPSMGAWINYGLGSESENLPGFVVINGGLIPSGGLDNFGNGFLPAAYQASIFNSVESDNTWPIHAFRHAPSSLFPNTGCRSVIETLR